MKVVGIKEILKKETKEKLYIAQCVDIGDDKTIGSIVYEEFISEEMSNAILELGLGIECEFLYRRNAYGSVKPYSVMKK